MSQWSAGFLWVRSLQLWGSHTHPWHHPHLPTLASANLPGFSFASPLSCQLILCSRPTTENQGCPPSYPVHFGVLSDPLTSVLLLSPSAPLSPWSPSPMLFETKPKQRKSSHSIWSSKVIFQTINNKSDLVIVLMESLENKRGFQPGGAKVK